MDVNLMKSIAEKYGIGKAKFGKAKERREYLQEIGMLVRHQNRGYLKS